MDEARRSSILKPPKQRAPLQDVNSLNINRDEFTVSTAISQHVMRRVSFAGTSTVKEFDTHAESVLVCHTPAYEESFATSDSSVPSDHSRSSSRSTSSIQDQSSLPIPSQCSDPSDPEEFMLKDFGVDSFEPPAAHASRATRYSIGFAVPKKEVQESPKLVEKPPSTAIPSMTFYSKSKPKPRMSILSSPRTQKSVTIDPFTLRQVVEKSENIDGRFSNVLQSKRRSPKGVSKTQPLSPMRRRSLSVPSQNDSSSSEMDLTEGMSGNIFVESPAVGSSKIKVLNQTNLTEVDMSCTVNNFVNKDFTRLAGTQNKAHATDSGETLLKLQRGFGNGLNYTVNDSVTMEFCRPLESCSSDHRTDSSSGEKIANVVSHSEGNNNGMVKSTVDVEFGGAIHPVYSRAMQTACADSINAIPTALNSTDGEVNMELTEVIHPVLDSTRGTTDMDFTKVVPSVLSNTSGTVNMEFTEVIAPVTNTFNETADMEFTKVMPSVLNSTCGMDDMQFTKVMPPVLNSTSGIDDMEFTRVTPSVLNNTSGTVDMEFTKVIPPMLNSTSGISNMEFTNVVPPVLNTTNGTVDMEFTKVIPPMLNSTSGISNMEFTNVVPPALNSTNGTVDMEFTKVIPPMLNSTSGISNMEFTNVVPPILNNTSGAVSMELTKVNDPISDTACGAVDMDLTKVIPQMQKSLRGEDDVCFTKAMVESQGRTDIPSDMKSLKVTPVTQDKNDRATSHVDDVCLPKTSTTQPRSIETFHSSVNMDSTKVIPLLQKENGDGSGTDSYLIRSQSESHHGRDCVSSRNTLVTARNEVARNRHPQVALYEGVAQSIGTTDDGMKKTIQSSMQTETALKASMAADAIQKPVLISDVTYSPHDANLTSSSTDVNRTAPSKQVSPRLATSQSSYTSSESTPSTQIDLTQFATNLPDAMKLISTENRSIAPPSSAITDASICRKRSLDECTDSDTREENQSKKCHFMVEPSTVVVPPSTTCVVVIPSSRSPSPLENDSSARFPGLCRSISENNRSRSSVSSQSVSPTRVDSDSSNTGKNFSKRVAISTSPNGPGSDASTYDQVFLQTVLPSEVLRNNLSPSPSKYAGITSSADSCEGSPIVPILSEAAVISSRVPLQWTPIKRDGVSQAATQTIKMISQSQDECTESHTKCGADAQERGQFETPVSVPRCGEEEDDSKPRPCSKQQNQAASGLQTSHSLKELTGVVCSELRSSGEKPSLESHTDSETENTVPANNSEPMLQTLPGHRNEEFLSAACGNLENSIETTVRRTSKDVSICQLQEDIHKKTSPDNVDKVQSPDSSSKGIATNSAILSRGSLETSSDHNDSSTCLDSEQKSMSSGSNTGSLSLTSRCENMHTTIADISLPSMIDISDTGHESSLEHNVSTDANLHSIVAIASSNVEVMIRCAGQEPAQKTEDLLPKRVSGDSDVTDSVSTRASSLSSGSENQQCGQKSSMVLEHQRCSGTRANEIERDASLERTLSTGAKPSSVTRVLPEESPNVFNGNELTKPEISKVSRRNDAVKLHFSGASNAALEKSSTIITKPKFMSLEEIFKTHQSKPFKHWTAEIISRKEWSFTYLKNFVELRLTVEESANGKRVSGLDGQFIPLYERTLEGVPFMAGRLLFQKLSSDTWTARIKRTSDVLNLLDEVNAVADDVKQFMYELGLLVITRCAQATSDWFVVKIMSMKLEILFNLKINCRDLHNIKPADISVEKIFGDIRETDIKKLVSCVKKDAFFLKNYVELVEEYIKTLEKV